MAGTYRAVGKLTVSETVKGALANINQVFTYTLMISDVDDNNGSYTYYGTNTGTLNFVNGTTPSGVFLDLVPFIILVLFGVFGILVLYRFRNI